MRLFRSALTSCRRALVSGPPLKAGATEESQSFRASHWRSTCTATSSSRRSENTLILTEQIKENRAAGLDDYHAVIEAIVQRTRPVILTALAAVLAFIPLTHSV